MAILVALSLFLLLMLLVIATPKFAPEVNLSKVTLLDFNEAKSAMHLIKDYTEENGFPESLFAEISVRVADRSGAALTNGGYPFELLNQNGKRIAAGRREMPSIPMLGLTITSSNLRIPIIHGTKAVVLNVGFQPPSTRTRALLMLDRIGLRSRFPKVCDTLCKSLPSASRWREKTYQFVLPPGDQ